MQGGPEGPVLSFEGQRGGEDKLKAEWKEVPTQSRWYQFIVSTSFVLRLELDYRAARYRIAVLSADQFGSALYRSAKSFDLEKAKTEAIIVGRRVALKQAKIMKELADFLREID